MARKFDMDIYGEVSKNLLEYQKKSINYTCKPKRVLQIVPTLCLGGGINAVVMNWYRNIDRSKLQFDFLYCKGKVKETFNKEIEQMGGHCYELPSPKHPFKFLKAVYNFFKRHRYATIHSHITHLNIIFFPLAKMFGTKNIIQHAHLTKRSDKKLNALRNYLMVHAVWPLITCKMACSKAAGKAYFGKNFIVVNNGIDINKFIYNPAMRQIKRKELGLENNFVIGHIGRFHPQKNHQFLIDIFKEVSHKNKNAKLILVGSGPLEQEIKNLVKFMNLQDKVMFLGVRRDIADLYQAFDCFVLPSLHEGLGIVAVEAQAAGLPCILADTLPEEAFICNYKKLPLTSVYAWSKEIISVENNFKRGNLFDKINAAGFSSIEVGKQVQNFYEELNK